MTSQEKKKKKKPLVQIQVEKQPELELSGSERYLTEHKIDEIIKKGKERLKHAITVSDIKLTKTKKEIIKEMAEDMEKAGYPVNQICDRLTKSLKGLVSERYVRELDAKYKNSEQSEVAKMPQNQDGGSLYRQQEQVSKKDVKEFTLEDIKVASPSKTKQVAKYLLSKKDWFEQQAKQNETKIADLEKENLFFNDREKNVLVIIKTFKEMVKPQYSDAEIGKSIRKAIAESPLFMKSLDQQQEQEKQTPKAKPKPKEKEAYPMQKEKEALLTKALGYRQSRMNDEV